MFGRRNDTIAALEEAADVTHPARLSPQNLPSADHMQFIRDAFFARLNPNFASDLSEEALFAKIEQAVADIVDQAKLPIDREEQKAAAQELKNDITGLGPVEYLLKDQGVTDILINGPHHIFAERQGRLEQTSFHFRDESHLLSVAKRIAGSVGRRVDESSPMIDARLADGSRVNIIIPPLSIHGTIVSIRKFPNHQVTLEELADKQAMSGTMAEFLEIAAFCRLNVLISGGTGAGKTTILNAMSGNVSPLERIVTIEDAAEINLQQPHVISLETRQRNMEGSCEVSQRDLLRNALRMRPDRIIVGEVRGVEAHDMLQAMNTGHDGSMSTIHANSPRDALVRVEDLVLSSLTNFNPHAVRRQLTSAIDLVVHVVRDFQGNRFIKSITEVTGIESDAITMQELFSGARGTSGTPEFTRHDIRPHCLEKVGFFGLSDRLLSVMTEGVRG
ncbi:MAG: CpaF family protein [Sneathiella sp.]|nr:CpaF family protein [Sneathiella sp.]